MVDGLLRLLSLSLSGALLTGGTALLARLLRGRISRTAAYYLWLPVLLRLLCPWGLSHTLMDQAVSSAVGEGIAVSVSLAPEEGADDPEHPTILPEVSRGETAAGAAEPPPSAPAAPQETVFSGASSSCLPSEPPEDAPETLGPGHFTSVQDRAEGEQDPYLELYADGTFMFMCNVYQGMTTYLGTWSYESGVLTLTRPSAEETYVFFAQDADTLLMHSGDLVMTQPGAVLTRLAQ